MITTSTVSDGPVLAWGPPVRVDVPPADQGSTLGDALLSQAPVAVSESGLALVVATPQEEGSEAATLVWFSPDGLHWEPVEHVPGVRLRSVARFGAGFVAVGRADSDDPAPATQAGVIPEPLPAVWTSVDGRVWTPATNVDLGPFEYGVMADVVATGSGLVAVGEAWNPTGQTHPAVWSSPDGLVWTMVLDDPLGLTEDRMRMQVAAGPEGLVAIGQANPVDRDGPGQVSAWWSPDGIRWRSAGGSERFGSDLILGELVAFGSGYALGGSRGAKDPLVWLSLDGRSWNNPTPLPTRSDTDSSFVDSLASDGSVLVAVGDDVIFADGTGPATGDASIWVSSDGFDWVQVPPEELRGDATLDRISANSVRLFGDQWMVFGTTWDNVEEAEAAVIWFST